MANDLDDARALARKGKDKQAVEVLYSAEVEARTDKEVAESLLQLASEIRDRRGGRVRRRAEYLADAASRHIARLASATGAPARAPHMLALYPCTTVSCDLAVDPAKIKELAFTEIGIALRIGPNGPALAIVPYPDITQLELGKAPPNPTAKRIGRGVGRAALGATVGILLSSGDAGWNIADRLLDFHRIYVTVRTCDGELVVEHRSGTPLDRLQIDLDKLQPPMASARTTTAETSSAPKTM